MLDQLPEELLESIYKHVPGEQLWSNVRPVCRRLNHSLRSNKYWLHRVSDQYGVLLPARLRERRAVRALPQLQQQPQPAQAGTSAENHQQPQQHQNQQAETAEEEEEDDAEQRGEFSPALRCLCIDRAVRHWMPYYGCLFDMSYATEHQAHFGTIDALRMFRVPGDVGRRRLCLSGARDRNIALWKLTGGLALPQITLVDNAHRGWIWCISVTPDAQRFYSAGWDSVIQQWHIAESQIQRGLRLEFDPAVAALSCIAEGDHILYASSYKQGPILFDLRTGTHPQRMQNCHNRSAVIEMATGPDCAQIFSIGEDNRLVSVDKRQFQILQEYQGPVSHVDFSGGQLCLSLRTGRLLFFNPDTLQLENELLLTDFDSGEPLPRGHQVIRVTKGATFCASSSDCRLRVFSPGLRPRLLHVSTFQYNLTRLDASPDGAELMIALANGKLAYCSDLSNLA